MIFSKCYDFKNVQCINECIYTDSFTFTKVSPYAYDWVINTNILKLGIFDYASDNHLKIYRLNGKVHNLMKNEKCDKIVKNFMRLKSKIARVGELLKYGRRCGIALSETKLLLRGMLNV